VRQENRDLKAADWSNCASSRFGWNQDAEQARRLQSLLGFKEQFISKTMAAQVIGISGSEQSRTIYIDKGSDDGVIARYGSDNGGRRRGQGLASLPSHFAGAAD
jgi:rod shape-determining protein MreC